MDTNLETPYEDETEFIECPVCDKSIMGDTLYKIHLTTAAHIKSQVFHRFKIKLTTGNKDHPKVIFHYLSKPLATPLQRFICRALPAWISCDLTYIFCQPNTMHLDMPNLNNLDGTKEDALVAAGHAFRQRHVPVFESIQQYLDYMKLDEPIIGLNYLEEHPCNDPQGELRYTCKLCQHTANLPEMTRHVIGRKHRQKYMETKRPDLVTWNKVNVMTQGGKIIRARAEIVERQDGRGTPTLMPKRGIEGRLNITRVPPRQKQNRDRNISQNLSQRDMPLPELKGRYSPGYPDEPPFHPEDPYGPMYQQEDSLSRDRMEEELQRADYRPEYMDSEYKEEYVEEPQRRAVLEPGRVPRYDLREMPSGQAPHAEYYPEEAPPYRKPFPERDVLKEFYAEEVRRRGQMHSAEYQPSPVVCPEGDEQRWSLDREPGRRDGMNRAGRQGSSEPEAKRRSFPTPMESDRSRDHLFNVPGDYGQEEAVAKPGPSRAGPPPSQRRVEAPRTISDIPEPFRRFLKGGPNNEEHGKRKRKSRFSDATAEEVETTKEMFSDEYGPPNPKFGGCPRPVSVPLRPEVRGTQRSDPYIESQSLDHTDSYNREDSESEGVFDMLKNIEIENAEEANFLKDKLCSLLKEFKTKKSENALQKSQGRAAVCKDYNSLSPDLEPSPRHQYDATLREDSDLRRPEDLYFKEDRRGRGWQQHEHIPDERPQEYHPPVPVPGEARQSNRSRYEEVFGWSRMSRTPHATHADEPGRYPERFQEHMHPRDYRPAADEFLDSPAPPLHMERGPRMDRGPRYSNSLDKITSTLLELVARK